MAPGNWLGTVARIGKVVRQVSTSHKQEDLTELRAQEVTLDGPH